MRVVLDSQLKIPVSAKMLSLPGRTLVLQTNSDEQKAAALCEAGAEVEVLASNNGRVDLTAV